MNMNDPAASVGAVVLDPDHVLVPLVHGPQEEPAGWIACHRRPDNGEWCMGGISRRGFGQHSPEWDVLSEDPLTLHPSLACRSCGSHGWVREGKWVSA